MPTVYHAPVDRVHKSSPQKPPPAPVSTKRPITRRHMSPALYATPDTTTLPPLSPSSPSSFPPPSPYLINHKRRGPRLVKSQSSGVNGGVQAAEMNLMRSQSQPVSPVKEENENREFNEEVEKVGGFNVEKDEIESSNEGQIERSNGFNGEKDEMELRINGFNGGEKDEMEFRVNEDKGKEIELNEGKSLEREDYHEYELVKPGTPVGEFFDAFEEISSDGGSAFKLDQTNNFNIDEELREMRLSLLMEIEKRKQADESLETLKNQWLRLSQRLSLIGLYLPSPSETNNNNMIKINNNNLNFEDSVEELCQQIVVTRFVSEAICKAVSRAEVAEEMDPVIQGKNFEISRLSDRVQYYETTNREMSLRNQETIELARQERNKKKRRQKWFWASIGLALGLGSAAIAWSYIPASRSVLIEHKDASTDPK